MAVSIENCKYERIYHLFNNKHFRHFESIRLRIGSCVDTSGLMSSALYGAQAGLKELAKVTLKIDSKLREIEK